MNTDELEAAVHSDPVLNPVFGGVYPVDLLPMTTKLPSVQAFIGNSDPSGSPGTHWYATYFTPKQCDWWDSYGFPPDVYGLRRFCTQGRRRLVYNTKTIQAYDSDVCGQHCLFFLWHRVRGKTLQEIERMMSNDVRWNDKNVRTFVRRQFNPSRAWFIRCNPDRQQCALVQRDALRQQFNNQ